jgi:hypothetical protein
MHPVKPPAKHFCTTRTALPMSIESASMVSMMVVPALDGQTESQRAQPATARTRLRERGASEGGERRATHLAGCRGRSATCAPCVRTS